ncbi:MAG: prepilin-type N-terminal cleavage/methylation domain-containing protein [Betaproteobacteria bacterium]|jgi:general secretion pathway protein I|nr:prepilin-type N-terminal cleavage/methylation domain-containing protein [Betaproteobacteria bacterium]MBK7079775.1 prepilin-type N-terminal cleavage/methylation domain-containing protein [Betaproteobacteria bacterium]MBK7592774.1 prepilin-type N-terminal cleavage/methylation domain-containing protein [Betaproteobacteria bacterium]MBK8688404.1 prepilin-type N-terminal cleavage/methylation domain-containing protein [Betaproteobacteria bacterium]MBK9675644.1 prepilin-type N-terminal cleavage/me
MRAANRLSPTGARRRAAGFSLLEVLVAFVILTLVATSLFRLFAGSLANVGAAEEYSRAVLVAESVLAEVGSARPLREGTRAGSVEDGRIEWKASVEPWLAPGVPPDLERASESLPTRLYRIAVEVSFPSPAGGQRTFALATTRIGPRGAP